MLEALCFFFWVDVCHDFWMNFNQLTEKVLDILAVVAPNAQE